MKFTPEFYTGYTYPGWLSNRLCWSIWKWTFCFLYDWHLWDEVVSSDGHYLVCDACDVQFGQSGRIDDPLTDEEIKERIIEWCDQTFPDENLLGKVRHLSEEVGEIRDELLRKRKSKKRIAKEIADVQIILWHLAKLLKIDAAQAAREKWSTDLIHRTWQKPDRNGVVHHVKGKNHAQGGS